MPSKKSSSAARPASLRQVSPPSPGRISQGRSGRLSVAQKAQLSTLRKKVKAQFGYDIIDPANGRRHKINMRPLFSEDHELMPQRRRRVIATTRDLPRNYAVAAWAIRKHLDYVSTFHFQSRTGVKELDAAIDVNVRQWSKPANCDIARRHSLRRMIRMAEARRTVDGDMLMVRMAQGRFQALNSERVGTPGDSGSTQYDPIAWRHGVKVDKGNAAIAYAIVNAVQHNLLERVIPAANARLHGYFEYPNQVRGISPITPAIGTMQDTYKGIDFALGKMLVSQLFGLVFWRKAAEAAGLPGDEGDENIIDAQGHKEKEGYAVDFGKGPVLLDLDPGDDAKFLESATPSAETREFLQQTIGISLKCLDLPFSFYDEAYTNYSGARQAWIQYDQSASIKRDDNRELLDWMTFCHLQDDILSGALLLPGAMTLADLKWEWLATGLPWIDPLKEISADQMAIANALESRTSIIKRRTGRDWPDVLAELTRESKDLQAAGLPTSPPTITAGPAQPPEPPAKPPKGSNAPPEPEDE
jgi:capsid protein